MANERVLLLGAESVPSVTGLSWSAACFEVVAERRFGLVAVGVLAS
jgi:hypothetical protein